MRVKKKSFFFVANMCICNKKETSSPNDIQYLFWAYFNHTNILKVTVNYLVTPIFLSGVKDGVENQYFLS